MAFFKNFKTLPHLYTFLPESHRQNFNSTGGCLTARIPQISLLTEIKYCIQSVCLAAGVFRTHRQPLASSLEGQVWILPVLCLCSHGQSLVPGSQRDRLVCSHCRFNG